MKRPTLNRERELTRPGHTVVGVDEVGCGCVAGPVIAAASIVAKVVRDHLMSEFDAEFPGYCFAQHKGYGTALHRSKLKKLGISAIHRRTFLKKWKVAS